MTSLRSRLPGSSAYVLFFIEIASRKVHFAGVTANPTGEWVVVSPAVDDLGQNTQVDPTPAQLARNLAWRLQDGALKAKFLLRDRDLKFTASFDQVLGSEGVEVVKLPFRSPRANSICERFIGTCRREVLDHLLQVGGRARVRALHVGDQSPQPRLSVSRRDLGHVGCAVQPVGNGLPGLLRDGVDQLVVALLSQTEIEKRAPWARHPCAVHLSALTRSGRSHILVE